MTSTLPEPVRKILSLSKGEINKLEREFQVYILLTISSIFAGIVLLVVISLLANDLLLLKLLLLLSSGIDFIMSYFLYKETLNKRQYLREVQALMDSGISVIEGIRKILPFGKKFD